jgi:hypothetical protein
MWVYWVMFAIPAMLALDDRNQPWRKTETTRREALQALRVVAVVFTVLIGLRYEVGADWLNYLEVFEIIRRTDVGELLETMEPGYLYLNLLSDSFGFGMYGVNTVLAAILMVGLGRLCATLSNPWLGMTAAVPYLVIVVGMGYSRQAGALGFEMLALVALQRERVGRFTALIVAGALFHRTVAVLLMLGAFASRRHRLVRGIWAVGAALLAYRIFLESTIDRFQTNYVEAEYASSGTLVRLLMNAVAGLLVLRGDPPGRTNAAESRRPWTLLAFASAVLLAAFFVSPSSTAVDRLALYALPLQVYAFGNLSELTKSRPGDVGAQRVAVAYCAATQFVWLVFGVHAPHWVPYRFAPFE